MRHNNGAWRFYPTLVVVSVLLAMLVIGQWRPAFADGPGRPVTRILRACASDEGESPYPCVWVASVDGNGKGQSFRIYRDGRVKQLTDRRARQLRGLPYGYSARLA